MDHKDLSLVLADLSHSLIVKLFQLLDNFVAGVGKTPQLSQCVNDSCLADNNFITVKEFYHTSAYAAVNGVAHKLLHIATPLIIVALITL